MDLANTPTDTTTNPTTTPSLDLNDDSIKAAIEAAAIKIAEENVQNATAGLVNKNKELIGEKKAVKDKYEEANSRLEALTSKYDFESIDEQLKQAEEDKLKALSAEERSAIRMEQLTSSFTTEKNELALAYEESLKSKEAENAALKGNMFTTQKGNDIKNAMAEHGGLVHLLEPHIASQTEVREDSGKFQTVVVQNGEVRLNTSGTPMTPDELVAEYKADEKYGAFFAGSKSSGGDGAGSNTTTSAVTSKENIKKSAMNVTQKVEYIDKHGDEAYNKLPY